MSLYYDAIDSSNYVHSITLFHKYNSHVWIPLLEIRIPCYIDAPQHACAQSPPNNMSTSMLSVIIVIHCAYLVVGHCNTGIVFGMSMKYKRVLQLWLYKRFRGLKCIYNFFKRVYIHETLVLTQYLSVNALFVIFEEAKGTCIPSLNDSQKLHSLQNALLTTDL